MTFRGGPRYPGRRGTLTQLIRCTRDSPWHVHDSWTVQHEWPGSPTSESAARLGTCACEPTEPGAAARCPQRSGDGPAMMNPGRGQSSLLVVAICGDDIISICRSSSLRPANLIRLHDRASDRPWSRCDADSVTHGSVTWDSD